MDDMLASFEARLRDLGLTAKVGSPLPAWHGVEAATGRLTRGASWQEYTLVYGSAVKVADAGRAGDPTVPTLVFTTFVAPKSAENFRRAGVQYLDTAGNARIEVGDVLVDVRGQRRPIGTDKPARTTAGNLFSTSRARVTFVLLAWPQLWKAPQRELAHAAGVSLGQAHNTLTLLTEAAYAPGRSRPGHSELLDLWAAAFPTGLAKKLTLATYRGDIDTVKKVHADDLVFLSGECAVADMLRPATLTLYVDELDPRLPVVNRWRSDGPPTCVASSGMPPMAATLRWLAFARRRGRWCMRTWCPVVILEFAPSRWSGGIAMLDLAKIPDGFLDPVARVVRGGTRGRCRTVTGRGDDRRRLVSRHPAQRTRPHVRDRRDPRSGPRARPVIVACLQRSGRSLPSGRRHRHPFPHRRRRCRPAAVWRG